MRDSKSSANTTAMSPLPLIPETAPFTPEQRAWLNGFLAGLFSRQPVGASLVDAHLSPSLQPLTILFGSQTGTAEALAKQAAKEAGKRGFAPTVLDMAEVTPATLAQHTHLLVITSTYGEGDPPDNAKALWEALARDDTPSLAALRYSVCALGDTNYTLFCQCGKDFDARLEKHGATRTAPRVDCDVDYDASFATWLDTALSAFGAPKTEISNLKSEISNTPAYSRSHPFPAPVLAVRPLNAPGSAKEVNHVEFDLTGSGLVYEAGDALGVVPQNCPELVSEILSALGCDGEEAVPTPVGDLPLRSALTAHYDLGKPTPDLLAALGLPLEIIHDKSQIIDILDALRAAGRPPESVTHWVTLLRKLAPRLYSISSSPKAHPGQVHLTVGAVRYEAGGRHRKGVCSTYLAERARSHGAAPVFVHSNKAFRPPADGATPIIMVGPGTGIAPFRAFLQERAAVGATGRNWLFFGDQRAATDFLYRDQLEGWRTDGRLHRLDTAFSRDQSEKVYVQHRMHENAAELWAWLEAGAHFYVCGDASRMAKDVDTALHRIVETVGGKSPDDAVAYIQSMKTAKRYQRDVY